MPAQFLNAARELYDLGISLIPIEPRGKRPLIPNTDPELQTWERYMHERATWETVAGWFGNGAEYNIGAIHGEVSNNYVVIDIDKDVGVFQRVKVEFPEMVANRVISSGSRKGYHIPLLLGTLPDFGTSKNKEGVVRARGNRTWKTPFGSVNIRAQFCQSLVPPSIHPDTNFEYAFFNDGPITWLPDLDLFISWLDKMAPQSAREAKVDRRQDRTYDRDAGSLKDAVLSAWPTIEVFRYFDLVKKVREERDGNLRVLGNGGLLIDANGEAWWNFEQDVGGGPIEAWGWQRFGYFNPQKHFRTILIEMAWVAGIDLTKFRLKREELTYLGTLRDVSQDDEQEINRWTQKVMPQWAYA